MRNPSAEQMRKFAEKFTKTQWEYLCCNIDFVRAIPKDLRKAKRLSDKILGPKQKARKRKPVAVSS